MDVGQFKSLNPLGKSRWRMLSRSMLPFPNKHCRSAPALKMERGGVKPNEVELLLTVDNNLRRWKIMTRNCSIKQRKKSKVKLSSSVFYWLIVYCE